MPRIAGCSIPKYRKHRASGQAVCTIAGRDYYLGPHGTKASKVEYDRLITEWLASGRSLSYGSAPDELSVSELLLGYLEYAKRRYKKGGRRTSEVGAVKSAIRPVRELYGKAPAAEFGPLALRAVREKLIADDYARKTINDHVEHIRRAFKWAVAEQLVLPIVFVAGTPGGRGTAGRRDRGEGTSARRTGP